MRTILNNDQIVRPDVSPNTLTILDHSKEIDGPYKYVDNRQELEKLAQAASQATGSLEKLSIAELGIYGGLVLKDLLSLKLPSAVILANALESIVEWTSNRMISENGTEVKLPKFFEAIGNAAAFVCRVKDEKGNLVQGSQALLSNKDKVVGALVTVMNSLGILNSAKTLSAGALKLGQARKNPQLKNSFIKNNSNKSVISSLFGILGPGFNTVSMLVCSILKEHFGKQISKSSVQKSAEEQKLTSSLFTSANEDARCALKSLLATAVDTLHLLKFPGAQLIDGIFGMGLNIMGIKNGISGLKGQGEEEDHQSQFKLTEQPILAKPLLDLGKSYLQLTGASSFN